MALIGLLIFFWLCGECFLAFISTLRIVTNFVVTLIFLVTFTVHQIHPDCEKVSTAGEYCVPSHAMLFPTWDLINHRSPGRWLCLLFPFPDKQKLKQCSSLLRLTQMVSDGARRILSSAETEYVLTTVNAFNVCHRRGTIAKGTIRWHHAWNVALLSDGPGSWKLCKSHHW